MRNMRNQITLWLLAVVRLVMPYTTVLATGHRPNITLKICLKCDVSGILVGLHHMHAQSMSLSVGFSFKSFA